MLFDALEGWFVHGGHTRTIMFARITGNVTLQRNRSDTWPEVVETHVANTEPVRQVPGIGQGSGQANYPQSKLGVGRDEVGSGHNDLQHWTSVLAWSNITIRRK